MFFWCILHYKLEMNMNNTIKIIVVDDSKSNTFLLKHILELEGYSVIEVNHGSVAINILPNEKPDLVILDVMMPEVTGFDVLKNMKSKESTKYIPVLMYSSVAEDSVINMALEIGANDYMYKPVPREELLKKVKSNLLKVSTGIS